MKIGAPFASQASYNTGHTQAVLWGEGEDWGHISQSRCPMIMATHRRCYGEGVGVKIGDTFPKTGVPWYRPHTGGAIGARGEDWGHLSQPRCPMLPATQRRCYGEGGVGKNWGHLSQPRRSMVLATHRRCYWGGGLKIGDIFPKPGAPWYRPHTGGAMGHLFQTRFSMLPATHRRCYVGEGVKIGDTFPKQGVPWHRPHTSGGMGGSGEDWGHFCQARRPMIPTTHRRWYGGSGEDWGHLSQARRPMNRPHTGSAKWGWGEGWRFGTPFPTQVPHDTDHTQAVLWGGDGEDWGHLFQPRCPMIPATHRRCYGKPFSSQVPHVTGHTQAVVCGGGWRLGTPFPSQASHDTGHTQAVL